MPTYNTPREEYWFVVNQYLRLERYAQVARYADLSSAMLDAFLDGAAQRFAAYDVPFSPVNGIAEVFDDPQVRHLDSFYMLRHPVKGELTSIRRPVLLDGSRDDQRAIAPPLLGEHTEAVLRELGLTA